MRKILTQIRSISALYTKEERRTFLVLLFLSVIIPLFEILFLLAFALSISVWQSEGLTTINDVFTAPEIIGNLEIYHRFLMLPLEVHLLSIISLGALSFLTLLLLQYIHLNISSLVAFSFSGKLYNVILRMNFKEFSSFALDQFVGVLGLEAQRFGSNVIVPLFSALSKIITIFAICLMVFLQSLEGLLIVLFGAVALLYALVSILNFRVIVHANRQLGEASKGRIATLEEFKMSFFLFKSRRLEKFSHHKLIEHNKLLGRAVALNNFLLSMPRKVVDLVLVVFLVVASLHEFHMHKISFSELEVAAVLRLIPLLQMLTFDVTRIFSHFRSLEPILEIVSKSQNIETNSPLHKQLNSIESDQFDLITINYKGGLTFKSDTNNHENTFTISRGEIVGISGPSGVGKSVFARRVCGYYGEESNITEIVAHVSGQKTLINALDRLAICDYVPQKVEVFDGTIAENLTAFQDKLLDDADGIDDFLHRYQLYDYVGKLNDGLSARLDPSWQTLSGGELQRLGILRAILSNKQILVFDETFSGMNRSLKHKIFNEVKKHIEVSGGFCLVVSHEREVLSWCNKVIDCNSN